MTVALIAVVVIAVGLPLLAWWLGGRRFWSRLRPGAEPDPWGDAMRQFGLTPQEAGEVESAVNWGRRLEDPRLRRAAVAWAQQRIDHDPRLRIASRWARMALLGVWVVVVGVALTWMTVRRGSFPWDLLLFWVVWPAVLVRIARGPYRALRLNAEVAPGSDEQSSTTADGGPAR